MEGGVGQHTGADAPVTHPLIPTGINTHDCPKCGATGRAQKSRIYHGTFRRDRKCVSCGHNFSTIEVQANAPALLFEAIQWTLGEHIDPEVVDWVKYTISKHMIGIVDPGDR